MASLRFSATFLSGMSSLRCVGEAGFKPMQTSVSFLHVIPKLHLVTQINVTRSCNYSVVKHVHCGTSFSSKLWCGEIKAVCSQNISLFSRHALVCKHPFCNSAKRLDSKLFEGSSRFLSKSTVPASATVNSVQNDLSLLIGKRVVRRPRSKDSAGRNQVTFYSANAFATAEEYNLETLSDDVRCFGYQTVKLPEDALDALLVEAAHPASDELRRIFFFREGSIVFWNVPQDEQHVWLQHLRPHQDGSYNMQMVRAQDEQMDYAYCDDRTQLKDGDIQLYRSGLPNDQSSSLLEMYAFSNALSLSVKLAVWEAMLYEYVDSIEVVLQDLKDGKKIRLSEADVLRKAGELFTLSHLINLSSDLLDTPDFYWDREDLGRLYNKTCSYLNIARRTKVMNEKLGQCMEIIELLRDHLKDKHHTRLEWMIIVLISVEVCFAVFHLIEKYYWNVNSD